MGIAAGGSIQQTICKDNYPINKWHKEAVIVFNVQILNSDIFETITGHKAPPSPVNAQTYAELGLPFFKLDEKLSGISGEFDKVKSVAEIDGNKEDSQTFPVIDLDQDGYAVRSRSTTAVPEEAKVFHGGAGGDLVNPKGPFTAFRCLKELEEEIKKLELDDWSQSYQAFETQSMRHSLPQDTPVSQYLIAKRSERRLGG